MRAKENTKPLTCQRLEHRKCPSLQRLKKHHSILKIDFRSTSANITYPPLDIAATEKHLLFSRAHPMSITDHTAEGTFIYKRQGETPSRALRGTVHTGRRRGLDHPVTTTHFATTHTQPLTRSLSPISSIYRRHPWRDLGETERHWNSSVAGEMGANTSDLWVHPFLPHSGPNSQLGGSKCATCSLSMCSFPQASLLYWPSTSFFPLNGNLPPPKCGPL